MSKAGLWVADTGTEGITYIADPREDTPIGIWVLPEMDIQMLGGACIYERTEKEAAERLVSYFEEVIKDYTKKIDDLRQEEE